MMKIINLDSFCPERTGILKAILSASLLMLSFVNNFSQYTSIDNYTGNWSDSASWLELEAPGNSIINTGISIYGELTSNACLDFNLSGLIVYDTLIINGNIELKNTCKLQVDSNAVLIVLGDYTTKNKVDVINNGTIIVAGKFEMLGADNQGSFINNGDLFIFDTIPSIKAGDSYLSISCTTNTDGKVSCGYKTKVELPESRYYSYYSSLPFDLESISIEGNSCYSLKIDLEETDYCVDEVFLISSSSLGIDNTEALIWEFGEDAVPTSTTGQGPHEVYYLSYGNRVITLTYPDDLLIAQTLSVDVYDSPSNNLYLGTIDANNNLDYNLDSICHDNSVKIKVDGGWDSLYHWSIPDLGIDTISIDILDVAWNVAIGEYTIAVSEISPYSCIGDSYDTRVNIVNCKEDVTNDIEEIYAFTPNGDGINDYWTIENIENFPLAKIKVFDRAGRIVYTSDGNYQNDWDGTKHGEVLDLNSYFFIIDFSAYQKSNVRGVLTILHDN